MSGPSSRDLDGHDPYALLGVPPTATRAEIVAAHRRLVQLVHPDRPGGSEYETKLLHIAKDLLLDPERRAEVDAPPSPAPDSEWDAEEWDAEEPVDFDTPPTRRETLWESEEVTSGVGPSHWDEPATAHQDPPYAPPPQAPQWQTPHWQPPAPSWPQPPAHVEPSASTMAIVALVCSVGCGCVPVGLVLGLITLAKPKGRNDRTMAVIAITLGSIYFLFFLFWLFTAYTTRNP